MHTHTYILMFEEIFSAILVYLWWGMRVLPGVLLYPVLFAFIGYVIDPDSRNSGKWYSDIFSTLGVPLGFAFALWIMV